MQTTLKGVATAALVYRAWSRKTLTPAGIATATITAIVHSVHPWIAPFALLAIFFLAGTAVTKVKHEIKVKLTQTSTGASGGQGARTHIQVLANSLVASVLILLHTLKVRNDAIYWINDSCWGRGSDVLVVGIVANYAAVAADTFSSELGILSKGKPRLITAPWRIVPPGTNGGVTATGLGAGLLGSFIIAATSAMLIPFCQDWTMSEKVQYTLGMTLAGFSGTLLDSLLGALFQASVVDVHSGKIVEGEGGRKVLIHGSSALFINTEAKVRKEVGVTNKDGTDMAKSSGIEDSTQASRKMQKAGASGSEVTDEHHESRKVEVGKDILDNNAVNLLMAASVSVGSMLVAALLWDLPLSSIISI